ncbi:hypothetical protein LSTR_LSTR013872 [Laodelphax striatellus]|uniref:RNA helicase n=1 Tax=Laodelphax striatellus TaxID=195883 RepID=A0A482XC04_LAOST|nr:hypothetical protein LSTR_LSTR013872 [Laodelphax striatellus]
MDASVELQAWCREQGLRIDIQKKKKLDDINYVCKVKLKSYEFSAVGESFKQIKAEGIACQKLLAMLEVEKQFQIPGSILRASNTGGKKAKSALQDFCSKRGLELEFERIKLGDPLHECIVSVDSFDFCGSASGPKNSVENLACKDFLRQLHNWKNIRILKYLESPSGEGPSGFTKAKSPSGGGSSGFSKDKSPSAFSKEAENAFAQNNESLNAIEKQEEKNDFSKAESFLTYWSEVNDVVTSYDFLSLQAVNQFLCLLSLESRKVGKILLSEATATTKDTASRLAAIKAVKYLLKGKLITPDQVGSIDLTVPDYDSDVLDNLQNLLSARTNNYNQSEPEPNVIVEPEKSGSNLGADESQNHNHREIESRDSTTTSQEPSQDVSNENRIDNTNIPDAQVHSNSESEDEDVVERAPTPISWEDILDEHTDSDRVILESQVDCRKSMGNLIGNTTLEKDHTEEIVSLKSPTLINSNSEHTQHNSVINVLESRVDNGKSMETHIENRTLEKDHEQNYNDGLVTLKSQILTNSEHIQNNNDINLLESRMDSNSKSKHEQHHDVVERAQTPISWEDIITDENEESDKVILASQDSPSPETDEKKEIVERSQTVTWQTSDVLMAQFKREVEKNRGKLDCRKRKVEEFLSDWCQLNNIALIFDYRFLETEKRQTIVCAFTLRSASIGNIFSTQTTAMKKYRAEKLAAMKAVTHLFQAELITYDEIKVNLDFSGTRQEFLDRPKNVKKNSSDASRKSMLNMSNRNFFDEIIHWNAKSKLQEWCTKNGLNLQIHDQLTADPSPWNVEVESFDYVATGLTRDSACQDFIDHLRQDYEFEILGYNNPLIGLQAWCVGHGLEMTFSRQNAELKHECKIKVDTLDFTGFGIGADKRTAESLACQDFIPHLEAANISEESNGKFESSTSESESSALPCSQEPLESIPCGNGDTDIGSMDKEDSHSEADSNAVLPNSSSQISQSVSPQNSTVSVAESEQLIIENNGGKFEVRTLGLWNFLCYWCEMNNISLTYDYHVINQDFLCVLYTLTLISPSTGLLFSTEAPGNSTQKAKLLAAKEAIIYLLEKEFVTSKDIEGLSLEASRNDKAIIKGVRTFLSEVKTHKKKSSLGVELIQKLEKSVDSSIIKKLESFVDPKHKFYQGNEKSQLLEWCSRNGLNMKLETRKSGNNTREFHVEVESFDYVGKGKGIKRGRRGCNLLYMACEDFIKHLEEDDKPDLSENPDPITALRKWCSERKLKMKPKLRIADPGKYESRVEVDTFDFCGTGIGTKRKSAGNLACRDFLNKLTEVGQIQDTIGETDVKVEAAPAPPEGPSFVPILDQGSNEDHETDVNQNPDQQVVTVESEKNQKYNENVVESRNLRPQPKFKFWARNDISSTDSEDSIVSQDEEDLTVKSDRIQKYTENAVQSRKGWGTPQGSSQDISCAGSEGSIVFQDEEVVTSSEVDIKAVESESFENSNREILVSEFKKVIEENRKKSGYQCGGVAITFLNMWCKRNNVDFTFDHRWQDPFWMCTMTLKYSTIGEFCSFKATSQSKKASAKLATKFTLQYLLAEKFIIPDENKGLNIDVSKNEMQLLESLHYFPSNLANQESLEVAMEPQEKSVTNVPFKKVRQDPRKDLEAWCLKNGLKVQFSDQLISKAIYQYNLSIKPYMHNGIGRGNEKKKARNMACEAFINRLPEIDKRLILKLIFESQKTPSSALHEWCSIRGLKPVFKIQKTAKKSRSEVKVESSDFDGTGNAVGKTTAQKMAAQDFLDRLKAAGKLQDMDNDINEVLDPPLSQQESHKEAVNDGDSDSDVEILNQQVYHNWRLNISQENDLSSEINNMLKRVDLPTQNSDLNFDNCIIPFGTANIRLQQFFDENFINANYIYSTDPNSMEGRHVASMKFYFRRIGRTFSASESASTETEAMEKCAGALVQQLYHANLIDIVAKKKRKPIPPIRTPIELNVPDSVIENIKQLCIEFEVDIPDPIPINSKTRKVLWSSNFTNHKESNATDYTLRIKYGGAKMNWNPWDVKDITRNQSFYNMKLTKISETLKSLQASKSQRYLFRQRLKERQNLPIFHSKNKILQLINDHPVTIVKGSTGSGKSTQVCQYILDNALEKNKGAYCNIIVIEPKRICASSLADRVAFERNEQLGQTVGYCVRFESTFPRSYGSILFCTPGSFIRRAESGLSGISHIIVDEIHERGVETDYILIILRRMLESESFASLKVILMSADVDVDLFSSYFGGCARITVNGKCFPVKDYFLEDCIELINFKFKDNEEETDMKLLNGKSKENLNSGILDSSAYSPDTLKTLAVIDEQIICPELIEAIILWMREKKIQGSILVFLPGWAEIKQLSIHLHKSENSANYCVLPLHSKIKGAEQKQVFLPVPVGKTKIILSTSLAESSVTIDDVICVIDSCRARISISQDNLSFKFVSEWASKVNLNQRLGRAGRLRPGYCFRLCTKARYEELPPDIEPQVFRVPLYNIVLSIKRLKLGNIREVLYSAVQPPPLRAIEDAERLLIELECLDNRKRLTPLGNTLARLPLDPRLGRMLLMSIIFDCPFQILKLAAYASTQEELLDNTTEEMEKIGNERYSDHIAVLHALSAGESLSHFQKLYETSALNLLDEVNRIEEQLYKILYRMGFDLTSSSGTEKETLDIITGLLCQAFYPNVCAITEKKSLKAKKVFLPSGKFGIHTQLSLIVDHNYKKEFKPPSPIFVFGEQTETTVNVCRNLTMVSPMHLLCFTNCKVVYEKGVVKIDDWLQLEMDPNAAAAVMCVRTMIEKALHEIVSDPSGVEMSNYNGLSAVVKQLCKTDFGQRTVDASSICSSSERLENESNS